ncbi:hypothetical protein BDV93DRAFT_512276 [Ceratobasidium sp. AG-I]|nr:hypothetical protein BDV93DRAFT_512276 [Ceratobasidium sp. AG-I]
MAIHPNTLTHLTSMSTLIPIGNAGTTNPAEVAAAPAPPPGPSPHPAEHSPALKSLWGIPLGHQHVVHMLDPSSFGMFEISLFVSPFFHAHYGLMLSVLWLKLKTKSSCKEPGGIIATFPQQENGRLLNLNFQLLLVKPPECASCRVAFPVPNPAGENIHGAIARNLKLYILFKIPELISEFIFECHNVVEFADRQSGGNAAGNTEIVFGWH